MLSGRTFAASSSIRFFPTASIVSVATLLPFLLTRVNPDLRPYVSGIAVEHLRHASAHRVEVVDVLSNEDDDHLPSLRVLAETDTRDARQSPERRLVAAENFCGGNVIHGSPRGI